MIRFFLTLIFLAVLTFENSLFAQLNYKPGYVVLQNNDTLKGLVFDGGIKHNSLVCKFKSDKKSEPQLFRPSDIKGYGVDSKKYASLTLPLKTDINTYFTEVLVEGAASLYKFYKYSDRKYFLTINKGSIIPLSIDEYWISMNTAGQKVYKTGDFKITKLMYKDTLQYLLRATGLETRVKELPYKDKPIQKIIREFNITKGETNSYIRNLSKTKNTIGIYSGATITSVSFSGSRFSGVLKDVRSTHVALGFYFDHPFQVISDRFSIQVGVSGQNWEIKPDFTVISETDAYTDISALKIAVPFSVRYSIKKDKWTPSVGIGKETGIILNSNFQFLNRETDATFAGIDYELYWLQLQGWFADAGLAYQISDSYGIFAKFRFQQQNQLVVEEPFYMKKDYAKAYNQYPNNKLKEFQISFQLGLYF